MAAGISTRNRATMEKSSLSLKLKACAWQRVTLFQRLDWKTPCLMHTLAKPITVITQRYLGVLRFCGLSQPEYHQKSALFISEIRVERSHSMFCTNCHKIDIIVTTVPRKGKGRKWVAFGVVVKDGRDWMTAAKNMDKWHRGVERGAEALDSAWRRADLRQSNVQLQR